jgi:hypothetical protein
MLDHHMTKRNWLVVHMTSLLFFLEERELIGCANK